VSNAWIEKLSEGPPINLNDYEVLLDLADDLESCELTLTVAGRLNQINNEDKMLKILRRVPLYLRSRWQKRVQEIRADDRDPNDRDPNLDRDPNIDFFLRLSPLKVDDLLMSEM